ncbi:MAG: PilZ domain-containing protein [Candidatus Acidiferrales bacterium]
MDTPGPVLIGTSVALLLAAIWAVRRVRSVQRGARSLEPLVDRRRAHRVLLATSVFVYGWVGGEPFSENTETLNVSAIGGLMPLTVKVVPSQKLILSNPKSSEDVPCRVARSIQTSDGKIAIGFEFLHTSANFWQVEFVSNPSNSSKSTRGVAKKKPFSNAS